METDNHPTFGNGKICYIELPSRDINNGGKIVQPPGMEAPEITARFTDPTGNILGLFQQ